MKKISLEEWLQLKKLGRVVSVSSNEIKQKPHLKYVVIENATHLGIFCVKAN